MRIPVTSLVLPCLFATFVPLARGEVTATEGEKLFALKVKPIFAEKCFACHGEDPGELKGDLNMLSREGLLDGGETFDDVLVPGDAAKSFLMTAVQRQDPEFEMPPKEAEKLTEEQAWAIRDWINEGAPWLSEERVAEVYDAFAPGVKVVTSGGLSGDWTNRRYREEDLWAYQPLRDPEIGEEATHPVDSLINAKLSEAGIEPAPPADRRTLIRRATFDLLGMPPAPEEIDAFLEDPAPDAEAFAALVERLLESPHYGEQWARHWLDIVRYADSGGYANDHPRPNAWRYRDYVIRCFNEDKPYDEFIREQMAGDEINPDDPEKLIATGFLRMGPWEHTSMSVAKITRQQFLDDITDGVGQVFLAHALQCARCHDHKFDPVPTKDYYSIQAVFATTQFADRDAAFLSGENRDGFEEEHDAVQARLQRSQKKAASFEKKIEEATRKWCEEKGIPVMSRGEMLKKGLPEEQIPPRDHGLSFPDLGRRKAAQKAAARFRLEMDAVKPVTLSVYNGKTRVVSSNEGRAAMPKDPMDSGELEETCILTGGDPFAKGDPVTPGKLSVVEGASPGEAIPDEVDGRRLGLADWIASAENPLTARVMANRIWQYHFGRGIAGNANNFGATGKKPTHPELLDWLAIEFILRDWSVKDLHRVIMNTEAYRRASRHPDADAVRERDPANELYALFQPRRLAAEELRDGMLFVSGELNPRMGGFPAKPEMNLEAALQPRHVMGGFAPAYQPDPRPEQRHRRSIYALKIRGLRDPFMEVFNQPGPDLSCELRDASTVSPQVFSLFNGQNSYDRSIAMARRLESETSSLDQAIERAFTLVYGRTPSAAEASECAAHVVAMREIHGKARFEPVPYPTEVVREGFEEMTGEPFTFTETLDAYERYVSDLKAWDVGPETRALADLCLVLLNSNEFAYVY